MDQESPELIRTILERARLRRESMLARRTVEAWRLLNGIGDGGPPGLTIDRYAEWFVVAAREGLGEDVPRAWGEAAFALWPGDGVVLKRLARTVRESSSVVMLGTRPEGPIAVREDPATFLVDLDDGLSTGLFLDQRDARAKVRMMAEGEEVLNLFAYTCAFSVHAALGGATRVTSVDVSKRSLRRGRENMERSGVDPNCHRWFSDDVFVFLARAARRGPRYGVVVVDPPVFGHGQSPFNLERDIGKVLEGCLAVTRPGGVLFASTHLLTLDRSALVAVAHTAAEVVGRRIEILEILGLPEWDHPSPSERGRGATPVDDRGNYLKTLVLRVG